MQIRKFFLSLILVLSLSLPSLAQLSIQQINGAIQNHMQLVQGGAQITRQMMEMAQMSGSSQDMQKCQWEMGLHQQMYSYLQQAAQNPAQFQNPQMANQFMAYFQEYDYRIKNTDWRPYGQIQGRIQEYANYTQWRNGTPQGRAAAQSELQQQQQSFNQNQANHQQRVQAFDQQQAQYRADSNQRDKYQTQYVNTIHDQYQYVNPYDGQSYMAPNTYNSNPVMQNADGSYTELVPYQNW